MLCSSVHMIYEWRTLASYRPCTEITDIYVRAFVIVIIVRASMSDPLLRWHGNHSTLSVGHRNGIIL